ncbi:MAG: excalibur calcium-binding domain-containing protein [Novosphingobium sp.]
MRFKQPFRAVPIKPDPEYMVKRRRRRPSLGPASLPVVPVDGAAQPVKHQTATPPPTIPQSVKSPRPMARRVKSGRQRSGSGIGILAGAVLLGATGGLGSVVLEDFDWRSMRAFAADAGLVRAREPQPGDVWSGCNAARAAGTAPIYVSEPGYRPEMDGDGDGIACEPYR